MRKRILVIDDVPDWQDQLYNILKNEYEVKTVASYEEAKEVIRNREAELAIVDLRLSPTDENNRDGMNLLKDLARSKINAIVLTGYPEHDAQEEAEKTYKAFDFIDKSTLAGNYLLIRNIVSDAFRLLEKIQKDRDKSIRDAKGGKSVSFSPNLSNWPLRRFRKKDK